MAPIGVNRLSAGLRMRFSLGTRTLWAMAHRIEITYCVP